MRVEILKAEYNGTDIILKNIGYLEQEKFDADEAWDICNWANWELENKPKNLFSDIADCSTEVVFVHPETNHYHIPLGIGWKICYTKESAIEHYKTDELEFFKLKAKYEYMQNNNIKKV